MNKKIKINLLFFILTFNISCTDKKPSLIDVKPGIENILKIETLKFTSGINSILQDSQGNYWFGSHREGVSLFNGNSFTYFNSENGFSNNHVTTIQEDKYGTIWIDTANGVSSYDGIKMTNHSKAINNFSPNVWMKTDNDLWFGAGNKEGVYRFDGQSLKYLAFPNPKIINPNNVYFVTGISEGKNDWLWIGTFAGVFGYNGITFTVINDETLGLNKETGELHIRSLLEDSTGRLWIGNNGIGVLLKEDGSIINFSEKHHLIHPKSTRRGDLSQVGTLEHVFVIEEDSQGNIWFSDRDTGVWKFDGKTIINYTINEKLSSSMVLSIYSDNNNNLLFGMSKGGVYQFNGKSFDKMF